MQPPVGSVESLWRYPAKSLHHAAGAGFGNGRLHLVADLHRPAAPVVLDEARALGDRHLDLRLASSTEVGAQ
jgi:hypothetical protein